MSRKLFIIYLRPHAARGTVAMRAVQLAEILNRAPSAGIEAHLVPLPRMSSGIQHEAVADLTGGVVLLNKSATNLLSLQAVEVLARNNHAILADWIDRDVDSPYLHMIDQHIASSRTQYRHLCAGFPTGAVSYVAHHADLRLEQLNFKPLPDLRPLFLGHRRYLPRRPRINQQLTIEFVKTEQDFLRFLPRLPEFNLHYNVRPGEQDTPGGIAKPLTKAFVAANCRSNVIMRRDTDDALDHLPADYPYFVEGDEPEQIRAVLDQARDDFGGPRWRYGLDAMEAVAAAVHPARIAEQMSLAMDRAMARQR